MSYLEIPILSAQTDLTSTTKLVINKERIERIAQGVIGAGQTTPTTSTTIYGVSGIDYQLTHTAAAAGFSVLDAIIDTWTADPGSGTSKVGGIPATVSGTGQALTFVSFTDIAVS
jgi:hypothetical protein